MTCNLVDKSDVKYIQTNNTILHPRNPNLDTHWREGLYPINYHIISPKHFATLLGEREGGCVMDLFQ